MTTQVHSFTRRSGQLSETARARVVAGGTLRNQGGAANRVLESWVATIWSRLRSPVFIHGYYSAFRQKFPKLWTSVVRSFLQQIVQNKSWAHPKSATLPRIYKVEMEHASLLFYLAKPQSGGVLVVTYVIVRQNHSISDVLLQLAERSLRSVLTVPCVVMLLSHVVPMFRALILITSVDRLGSVALRSEILSMPFFHLFDFFDISKCSHRFHFQAQKDHGCVRPFLAKNNSLPLLMIQSRQDTHTQKLKLRP